MTRRCKLQLCERDDHRCPTYSKSDYPFIHRGFIVAGFRLRDGLCTYFQPNNETANVYTQLAGLLLYIGMLIDLWRIPIRELALPHLIGATTNEDIEFRRWCVTGVIAAAIVCCTSSLLTHMYQARSAQWHRVLSICDWSGTLLVTLSVAIANDTVDNTAIIDIAAPSFLKGFLFTFTGHGHLMGVFLLLGVTLSVLAFAHTTHLVRFWLVFGTIVVTCLPAIALVFAINPVLAATGMMCFVVAGTFFGTHFPERAYPRRFDICCPSHAFWHVGYLSGLTLALCAVARVFLGRCPWIHV